MESNLENLVVLAQDGDRQALEEVVRRVQDRVYGLALRMLFHPSDAEDATQEVLIKVITKLGTFEHRSAFTTWVYRIAANHLLTTRRSRAERMEMSFERFADQIDRVAAKDWDESDSRAQQRLIIKEMLLNCLQAMLICLDRDHRVTYILGQVFEVNSKQGAYILDITPVAFRKRLSRARERIQQFMERKCSLIRPDNPCHCTRMAQYDLKRGWINAEKPLFARHPARSGWDSSILDRMKELNELNRVAALFQSHPDYAAPETFLEDLKTLIDSGRYSLLNDR